MNNLLNNEVGKLMVSALTWRCDHSRKGVIWSLASGNNNDSCQGQNASNKSYDVGITQMAHRIEI